MPKTPILPLRKHVWHADYCEAASGKYVQSCDILAHTIEEALVLAREAVADLQPPVDLYNLMRVAWNVWST